MSLEFEGEDYEEFMVRMSRDFGEDAAEAVLRDADVLGDVFEAKSVELAPVQTGALSRSTVVQVARRRDVAEIVLRYTVNYAAQVHQLPEAARGPRTRARPGNEFGQAGPQFISRPLRGAERWAEPVIGALLRDAWREA